jgi:predicted DCC family thiol-disulfide oxidoreductase YuxK
VSTFLYDGDCAFCSSCARFITRFMRTPVTVAPWQFTDYQALGLSTEDCDSAVQWIGADGSRAAGPPAIARLLRSTRGVGALLWRPAGWSLSLPPVRWLAWPVYRWVARNRDKMPGGTAACAVPQAQRAVLRDQT